MHSTCMLLTCVSVLKWLAPVSNYFPTAILWILAITIYQVMLQYEYHKNVLPLVNQKWNLYSLRWNSANLKKHIQREFRVLIFENLLLSATVISLVIPHVTEKMYSFMWRSRVNFLTLLSSSTDSFHFFCSALAWLAGVVSLNDLRLSANLPRDNFGATVAGEGKITRLW